MNIFQQTITYFREAIAELQKVAWPKREDITRYTILVVSASVVAAVFFGVLDNGLSVGVRALIAKRSGGVVTAASDTIIPQENLQVTEEKPKTINLNGPTVTSTLR